MGDCPEAAIRRLPRRKEFSAMTSFYSSSERLRWRVREAATIIAVSRLFQRRLDRFFLRENSSDRSILYRTSGSRRVTRKTVLRAAVQPGKSFMKFLVPLGSPQISHQIRTIAGDSSRKTRSRESLLRHRHDSHRLLADIPALPADMSAMRCRRLILHQGQTKDFDQSEPSTWRPRKSKLFHQGRA
jgi:hypothetical protein